MLTLVHPFAASRDFPSRGNEKYGEEKQRVIYFMYHFAVSLFGGERSEPITRMVILPYDTESKSRNVLASPLGEEGHEVAKGCTRVRMIMILDVDVTAERRHYNIHRPIGRYHNPQRRRRCCPPEQSEATQPFYTTCRRSRPNQRRQPRPLYTAAKPPPQPSARRAVKLKNLPRRTLTPVRACQKISDKRPKILYDYRVMEESDLFD